MLDNAELAAGVKQSAKISFEDEAAPARSRLKTLSALSALSAVDKNNALNLEDRIDGQDSNIKIEGMFNILFLLV